MDDYISKTEALDIVRFECGEWSGLAKTIEKRFDKLPSEDVQPVVWCGECKCFDIATNGVNGFCNKLGVPFDVYDYCSLGERKDGEQNE